MADSHRDSFKSLISGWFRADISAPVITSRPSDHEGSVSSFTESHGVIMNVASSWMLIVLLLVKLAVCPSASPSMKYSHVCFMKQLGERKKSSERRRHVFLMVDTSKAVCLLPSTQDPPHKTPFSDSCYQVCMVIVLCLMIQTHSHTLTSPTGFSADSCYQICMTITLPPAVSCMSTLGESTLRLTHPEASSNERIETPRSAHAPHSVAPTSHRW